MASHQAWKLCPQGVFVHSSFGLYKEVSQQIRDIFFRYTELVEPVSLDEAYLDVGGSCPSLDDAVQIAIAIKADILATTRLTCSAGVSINKFLAKIGSDMNKPDGLTVISPETAPELLFKLPIGKFHGIGRVTAAKMEKLGIHNGADLYQWELKDLMKRFGKVGLFYYNVVRGIDTREVITSWDPKSISCENTFYTDIADVGELIGKLQDLVDRLVNRMSFKGIQGKNIVIKIKYDNFDLITRSCALPEITADKSVIFEYAQKLLVANWDESRKIRLLGVGVGKLDLGNDDANCQLCLPLD